ncbi:MAG: metallophosphoesterase family protein [Chryseolinea sp.]
MKIGLLSDTHDFLDPKVFDHFRNCDEIWHAGDIGDLLLMQQLEAFKPSKAVFGNIDDKRVQIKYPEDLFFECEGLKILITHIGGKPPIYNPRAKTLIMMHRPDIFICGHSHMLLIKRDETQSKMLFINPGAAGNHGFHTMKTLVRFELIDKAVRNMEVIELGKRGALTNDQNL